MRSKFCGGTLVLVSTVLPGIFGVAASVFLSNFSANQLPAAMKTGPVPVLRLPRGPDPNSRGFDPNSPRYIALCPTSIPSSAGEGATIAEEQRSRTDLRERFLRTLIKMSNKPVCFDMYEGVQVQAKFGASDIDVLNFQVSELQTPIGVQKEALLRCQDMISFSFEV